MKKLFIILSYFFLLTALHGEDVESVEIISDEMEWDKQKGIAIALGNAKATKGTTVITASKIIATFDDSSQTQKIIKLVAIGKVKLKREGEIAKGKTAIYDLEKDTIVIKGNVNLKRENNIMVGETLFINLLTGFSKLSGSKSNEKVKMKYNTKN